MATQDDFTPDEWKSISELPGRVLGAVTIADGKNVIKMVKEAAAGGTALTAEVAKYPGNAIVQAFAGDGSFSAPPGKASDEEVVNGLMAAAESTIATIRAKASAEEFAEVAAALTAVATAVANAAGSGMFGGGADKVDPREQAVLDRLAVALSSG